MKYLSLSFIYVGSPFGAGISLGIVLLLLY
jgi:hypothetical protein